MTTAELHRPLEVRNLRDGETGLEIVATAGELAALARRFGLISLDSLRADIKVWPESGGRVEIEGRYSADVVQSCVVTLKPVASRLEAGFHRSFAEGVEEFPLEDEEMDTETDPPDPIIGDTIDLGEVVAEQLSLDLDPFPRAEGVEFSGFSTETDGGEASSKPNPFAVLGELRRN